MRIELHELWDEKASWGIERGVIAPEYVSELIFHHIRFFFTLGRKAGTSDTEGQEESFEYGCVSWVVEDFSEVEGRPKS